jgi:hypothetical protein
MCTLETDGQSGPPTFGYAGVSAGHAMLAQRPMRQHAWPARLLA